MPDRAGETVLILLPPSEGKAAPAEGPPLDLASLSLPGLTGARRAALAALSATSLRTDALERLRAPVGAAASVAANVALDGAPTARAAEVYSGVLYEALDLSSLPGDAAARAAASVRIFSAVFGVLSPDDWIPAYRASAASRLDGVGTAAAFWRRHLGPVLDEVRAEGSLVVDARSGGYAAFWRPAGALAVTVFADVGGRRRPVSHWAKQARGYVARALLEAGAVPTTPDGALDAVRASFASRAFATAAGRELHLDATLSPDRTALEVLTR